MSNFIAKHWNGEYSLWRSYWVNTCLIAGWLSVPVLYAIIYMFGYSTGLLVRFGIIDMPKKHTFEVLCQLIYTVLALGITTWSYKGTWIAASKYSSEKEPGWGVVAKIMLVISSICLVVKLTVALVSV